LNNPVSTCLGEAGEAAMFELDAPNVILETLKLAEDGSGDLILRLYEAKRTLTKCKLSTPLRIESATLTDMLERFQSECPVVNGKIELEFLPFEIKTLRLSMKH
jgi:alpha-mannosidase